MIGAYVKRRGQTRNVMTTSNMDIVFMGAQNKYALVNPI
jgi:hypothetical protein